MRQCVRLLVDERGETVGVQVACGEGLQAVGGDAVDVVAEALDVAQAAIMGKGLGYT